MALFSAEERAFAEAVTRLARANPFLQERVDAEHDAVGAGFDAAAAQSNLRPDPRTHHPSRSERPHSANWTGITEKATDLAKRLRDKAVALPRDHADLALYSDLIYFLLYARYIDRLPLQSAEGDGQGAVRKVYGEFLSDWEHYLGALGRQAIDGTPDHVFAILYQIRRAFYHVFLSILGGSAAAIRLRGAVWESIFTCDMHRYGRVLYQQMNDFPTLITGPSGTGKELVARAIALSRYIPFDARKQTFEQRESELFYPLHLAALSPTLIESELFGHAKGSFTGATSDRQGWLEICPGAGTVFLDEVGEVEERVQVKLLRVLETRTLHRIGDTRMRRFEGRISAATNRDIDTELEAGRLRLDFYYRLCADEITTPSLRDMIADDPDELRWLVRWHAVNLAGSDADEVTQTVMRAIETQVGWDYDWPGNMRELQQCIRNILIRGVYRPQRGARRSGTEWARQMADGGMTAGELMAEYCAEIVRRAGSYAAAGKLLQLDPRTVRTHALKAAEPAESVD